MKRWLYYHIVDRIVGAWEAGVGLGHEETCDNLNPFEDWDMPWNWDCLHIVGKFLFTPIILAWYAFCTFVIAAWCAGFIMIFECCVIVWIVISILSVKVPEDYYIGKYNAKC